MRVLITLFITLISIAYTAAQQDGVIDDPGDIAFVAMNDSPDGFSFLFIDDCPAGTVIQFTDKEWDGATFDQGGNPGGEGIDVWTNTTSGVIAKGTVVHIQDANFNPSASVGSVSIDEGGFTTGTLNDQIYAVVDGVFADGTGYTTQPSTFIAFIGYLGNASLSNTGLTLGTTAVEFNNEGYYSGSTSCNGTLTDCLQMINNSSNWALGGFNYPADVPNTFTGSVLPIELISFNANLNIDQVELKWSTASEINNDYMAIEKSRNGKDFKEIGREWGAGNSSSIQNYQFIDQYPDSGNNYYRLRQVDFDGNEQVFQIVNVRYEIKGAGVVLFPTYVEGILHIDFNTRIKESSIISIYHVSGRKVMDFKVDKGDEASDIVVEHLEPGTYLARILIDNQLITKKFIKQ